MSVNVVICGAGIAGVTTAYQLAVRHGLKDVVIVDPLPPLTMTMMRRGRSSASTNSSSVSAPVKSPSEAYSPMKSFVFDAVRLWTAMGTPRRAMLRARFAPITASPVTPIWLIVTGP